MADREPSADSARHRSARRRAGGVTVQPDARVQPPPLNDGTALLSLIARAYRHGRRRMEQTLRARGVTDAQFNILLTLSQEPGLSGIEVADRAFITPQAAHAALATLQGKGFVTREAETTHRRMVRTVLTDEGAEVLNACLLDLTEMGVDMGVALPEKRRRLLIELLDEYVGKSKAAARATDSNC